MDECYQHVIKPCICHDKLEEVSDKHQRTVSGLYDLKQIASYSSLSNIKSTV